MRLIDADRLLERLSKNLEYFEMVISDKGRGIAFGTSLAIDRLNEQPTIDSESLRTQWIPVAERLPPEEQYVLITQKERYPGQAEEGEFHPVVEACFSDNCWFMSDGEVYFYDEDVVYAWMPLPEPYEPDGVGQKGE